MKFSFKIVTLLSIVLVLSACKKTDIPDIHDAEAPIFIVEGTLGDETIELQAGIKGAYMSTEVETFNNLPLFTGKLGTKTDYVQIQLFTSNVDIPSKVGKFNPLDKFTIGQPYGEEPLLKIAKEEFYNYELISTINWAVNGTLQEGSTLELFEPGSYDICAEVVFNTGEKATTCNNVIVGFTQNAELEIDYEIEGGNAHFSLPFVTEINTVKWYINNQEVSTETDFFSTNLPEKFTLKAEAQFQNGAQLSKEIFLDRVNGEHLIEDFTLLGYQTDLVWDNTINFKVQHNGNQYRALNTGLTPYLTIEEIKDFKNNNKGEKVKLIIGTLDGFFMNTETEEVSEGSFKIHFGIAHDK